ncbi:MAG: HlyD family type I secretion periplasmic adaptor subunit [Hyphomicrobiaceae bacterium]
MTVTPNIGLRVSIRHHVYIGLVLVIVIVGGVGGWAATAEISGAVIASGTVVVDSNTKKVQHRTGGIVSNVLVRDGDQVTAGDIVLRLDPTILAANRAMIEKRLVQLLARKARLEAERDGVTNITFPENLLRRAREPFVARVVVGETKLFDLRRTALTGQQSQLRQRIVQMAEEIGGLTSQVNAKNEEVVLVQRELGGARELWGKKLMPIARLTAIEREATRLVGQRGKLKAEIARAKGRITEIELQIVQIDRDLASEVAGELREIDAKLGEFVERKIAADDEFRRIDIRAPQSGTVHQSTVHTVGAVINAGETVMLIVPNADDLTVEAKVAPQDIDQLQVGQTATLRFAAFNRMVTPEINGRLSHISADITTDERSGLSHYVVRIALGPDDVGLLGNVTLVPGMPVEAFIRTGDRKVITYLVKPISDQIMRSFRED